MAKWVTICSVDDILPDTGVCALLDGQQVAIFRVGSGEDLYAVDNFDPFSRANVLSRGIVGDCRGEPKVAAPMYKQSFSLRTGRCFDDPAIVLRTYELRVARGRVQLRSDVRAGAALDTMETWA